MYVLAQMACLAMVIFAKSSEEKSQNRVVLKKMICPHHGWFAQLVGEEITTLQNPEFLTEAIGPRHG